MNPVKLLGSLLGNNATGGNMLGSLLKGAMGGGQQKSGGAGALGMLSGLLGGGQSQGGGPMGMLSGILGGGKSGGAMGLLGGLLGGGSQAESEPAAPAPPSQSEADQATLLIRAMCNAAKADGEIDQAEQDNIIGRLGGDLDQAEADFLRKELSTPLDVAGFARQVPSEMAANVYAFSVMTVKVDTREEVAYLKQLAQHLDLDGNDLNSIHQQLGLG